MPIPATKARNFEELLEKQLGLEGLQPCEEESPPTHSRRDENCKREFLRRKSKKPTVQAGPTKKYNYYVDNFDENKRKDRENASSGEGTTTTASGRWEHARHSHNEVPYARMQASSHEYHAAGSAEA